MEIQERVLYLAFFSPGNQDEKNPHICIEILQLKHTIQTDKACQHLLLDMEIMFQDWFHELESSE